MREWHGGIQLATNVEQPFKLTSQFILPREFMNMSHNVQPAQLQFTSLPKKILYWVQCILSESKPRKSTKNLSKESKLTKSTNYILKFHQFSATVHLAVNLILRRMVLFSVGEFR